MMHWCFFFLGGGWARGWGGDVWVFFNPWFQPTNHKFNHVCVCVCFFQKMSSILSSSWRNPKQTNLSPCILQDSLYLSGNTQFIPSSLHTCNKARKEGLDKYQFCQVVEECFGGFWEFIWFRPITPRVRSIVLLFKMKWRIKDQILDSLRFKEGKLPNLRFLVNLMQRIASLLLTKWCSGSILGSQRGLRSFGVLRVTLPFFF